MAYALVGAFGTVATGTASVTPAFAQATTSGNLLVAWVVCFNQNLSGASSGWSQGSISGTGARAAIYYKPNSAAGETAPTFTSASGTMWACLAEFSGGATASPLDQAGGGFAGASPVVAACGAADIALGQLFLSCAADTSTKAETVTTSETYNNGATATGNASNDATSLAQHYRFAYGITTSKAAADQTSHASSGMNLTQVNACVASFKLAAVAAAASLLWSPPSSLYRM